MTLSEKTTKLLGHSVIVNAADKKMWLENLPKMDQSQVQVIYGVLVDEVRAWKREGVSIISDTAVEMQLLPAPDHGATLDTLKARLSGQPPKPAPPKPEPIPAPAPQPLPKIEEEDHYDDFVLGQTRKEMPRLDKNAWMLSEAVVVPKNQGSPITPTPSAVPRIRNRVARHGMAELAGIRTVDDLRKIEAAHLRQSPLRDQLAFIRQRITQLAQENDMLPVNVIPVFEQSPLFQTYLKAGSMMIESNTGDTKLALDQVMAEMENMGQDTLTQLEFEGVADLRKELESVAGL